MNDHKLKIAIITSCPDQHLGQGVLQSVRFVRVQHVVKCQIGKEDHQGFWRIIMLKIFIDLMLY